MNTIKRNTKFLIAVLAIIVTHDIGDAMQSSIPEFLKSPIYRSDESYRKSFNTPGNRVNITFTNTGLLY